MAYSTRNTNTPAVKTSKLEDFKNVDTLEITGIKTKNIKKKFGKGDDFIELHIYNSNNQVIYSEPFFEDYKIPQDQSDPQNISSINIDPNKILNDRGFITGIYKIKLNVLKHKVLVSPVKPFLVKEISSDRREIRSITPDVTNKSLNPAISGFISDIESSVYFKEFSLNFGNDLLIPSINILLNKDPDKNEVLIKTFRRLPLGISENSIFDIVEEISDPIIINVDLGGPEIQLGGTPIARPNFTIDVRQNNSVPSSFKTFDEILNYNVTSSYQHLLNRLETNTLDLNIQYDYIRPVSSSTEDVDKTYHFENFTHFSSAVERLNNFKYKLELIESYNKEVIKLENISSPSDSSISNKNTLNKKIETLIKGFDGYEHFLYFESGAYSWPKQNTVKPYLQSHTTSSEALTWLGDHRSEVSLYGGQLLSASFFDRENPYNLNKLVPTHIQENSTNSLYTSFVNMVGQHFDHIWTHIKALSNNYNNDNIKGISKDLVYHQLKSIGIEVFDQFENAPLSEYFLGEGTGSNVYDVNHFILSSSAQIAGTTITPSETLVSASNNSIPKGDISKEIWKRLYHNAPYLLKTKGTERGLKALMSCYGVPSTILNVKEYGGSTVTSGPYKNLDTSKIYKTFSYDKSGLALHGDSGTNGTFLRVNWSSSLTNALSASAKTIEFRINPVRSSDNQNYHLMSLAESNAANYENIDHHFILSPYTGNDISSSGDAEQYGSIQYRRGSSAPIITETSPFPVFNGNFWNIFAGIPSGSSGVAPVKFGAYQANFNKNVTSITTQSVGLPEATVALSWGAPTSLPLSHGGAKYCYIGGKTDDDNHANVDDLRYSGSIQEVRFHFGELLSHETLKKHALEPFMYSGNSVSSSYSNLVFRAALGSNNKEVTSSFHPNENINYLGDGISQSMDSQSWKSYVETHHLPTPDTVGASMSSEKVRIDNGTIDDNILSPFIKSETSTLDRQALDYEDLGIFFSPTNEINEDIVYTLGGFRMDDYIGSPLPSDQSSSFYNDLKELKDIYFQKINRRHNYWDYIKQIQYIDHTLFKMIEQFVPARANTKTGLLIEPHFLERTKFKRAIPQRSDAQTMTTGLHQNFEGAVDGKIHTMRSSSAKDFGQEGINNNIKGQHDPGSYVIYHSNLSSITGSDGIRQEQGTNAAIDIYGHIDPSTKDPNRENAQSCQAPITPYDPTLGQPTNYVAHESSVLLGNMMSGKMSRKYYKYKRYNLTTSSLYVYG
tara:strand:+ start:9600 stop:13304 length:3705 start_codon:yes stop_codon:yes gene_type:complete